MSNSLNPHGALTERPMTVSLTPHSRNKGTRERGTRNEVHLQDQTSRLTTAHAFGDWTWT
jgi:hypothetical protein